MLTVNITIIREILLNNKSRKNGQLGIALASHYSLPCVFITFFPQLLFSVLVFFLSSDSSRRENNEKWFASRMRSTTMHEHSSLDESRCILEATGSGSRTVLPVMAHTRPLIVAF